jgi:hypothetical protein
MGRIDTETDIVDRPAPGAWDKMEHFETLEMEVDRFGPQTGAAQCRKMSHFVRREKDSYGRGDPLEVSQNVPDCPSGK